MLLLDITHFMSLLNQARMFHLYCVSFKICGSTEPYKGHASYRLVKMSKCPNVELLYGDVEMSKCRNVELLYGDVEMSRCRNVEMLSYYMEMSRCRDVEMSKC